MTTFKKKVQQAMMEPEISGPYLQGNRHRPGPTMQELKEELIKVTAERDLLLQIVRHAAKI